MLNEKKSLEMIESFGTHYNYDTSYMKEMLRVAPEAYETFENFLPMASYSKNTPKDVLHVTKIAAMQFEDCAACLQLAVDIALEAGVDKEIIKDVLFNKAQGLSSELKYIYDFTLAVVQNIPVTDEMYTKIEYTYSPDIIVELSLAIASAKVFPAIKRTLNEAKSCSVVEVRI